MLYEVANPTTELAEPYERIQKPDDPEYATEMFVDNRDIPIPVGHESVYTRYEILASEDN